MKETLAFQIVILYREFLSYTTNELKTLGLSFGQMPLVVYVGKHPGCTQADLTRALKLDWGYSQRSISRLADSGFLTKKYNGEKACHCLELTAAGRQAFDVSHRVFYEWDEMKLKNLSDDERASVIALLKNITV